MAFVVQANKTALPKDEILSAYRLMLASRRIDDKEVVLKQQNLCFFQISGAGHEAIQVAAARHLDPRRDWFFTYYRDRALVLALGATAYEMFLASVGAAAGPDSHGRQMPSHFGQKRLHCPVGSSPTGTQCLHAAGFAQAGRLALTLDKGKERLNAGEDEVVWVSLGDGTTSEGEFWESLNTACNLRLPMLYVIEDNGYAISTTVDVQTPGGSISRLLRGFPNLALFEVDGCDYPECYAVMEAAVEKVRSGEGPALVHAHVVRPYSHSLSDDERLYKTVAEREHEAVRDPLVRAERLLRECYGVPQESLDAIDA